MGFGMTERTTSNLPEWGQWGLGGHYKKRLIIDRPCWPTLLSIPETDFTQERYKLESQLAIKQHWISYNAESIDKKYSTGIEIVYHPYSNYHVDSRLVTTIINLTTNLIHTCFHEHFDSKSCVRIKPNEQQIKYMKRLTHRVYGILIRSLTINEVQCKENNINKILRVEVEKIKNFQLNGIKTV